MGYVLQRNQPFGTGVVARMLELVIEEVDWKTSKLLGNISSLEPPQPWHCVHHSEAPKCSYWIWQDYESIRS
jgi:hypothetical protein